MNPKANGAAGSNAPPHPARRLVWIYGVLGVMELGLGVYAVSLGALSLAGLSFLLMAATLWVARTMQVRIPAVQALNVAVQQLTRGHFAETEAVLATIGRAAARDSNILRAVSTIRALIALYEGRASEAEAHATRAIDARLGVISREIEQQQITAARAVRALARAARGDVEGAKRDVDAAEGSVHATPEVIARARLVRALLASRAAYHEEAFRKYLAANARLILEHAMPRERTLFRALRRMSRSRARSVYREPARVGNDRAPSKVASWIATMSPEAASFIDGDRLLADSVEEPPVESVVPSDVNALRRARAGKKTVARPGRLALWAAASAVVMALVWQFLTLSGPAPSGVATTHAGTSAGFEQLLVFVAIVAFAVALTVRVSLMRRRNRALAMARRMAALGERGRAEPALVALAAGPSKLVAAGAGLELAKLAAQEGRFAEAIGYADAAMTHVQKQPLRAVAADILLPSLMTESAAAMAARGGIEEAAAELAVLERDFPTYSQLALAQLRVRLMSAVRQGNRERARALALGRTADMRLPYREDVLADLVLASRGDLDEQDLGRLDAELADDAALRTWLDRVGPGLRAERPADRATARVSTVAPPLDALDALDALDDEHAADDDDAVDHARVS